MSNHTAAEFFAGFEELAQIDPDQMTDHDFMRIMVKHVPKADGQEMAHYLNAWQHQKEAEAAEHDATADDIQLDLEMCEGFPENTPFRTIVETRAAEGHPRALAYLAEWADPRTHARQALFEAAVEAHPAWHREGDRFVQDTNIGGPEDDTALVDWYQRTYPREAAAIEARFVGGSALP